MRGISGFVVTLAMVTGACIATDGCAGPASSPADKVSDLAQRAVQKLFESADVSDSWFSPDFLASIPISRVQGIVERGHSMGQLQGVTGARGRYVVTFEQGIADVQARLDDEGRFTFLVVHFLARNSP